MIIEVEPIFAPPEITALEAMQIIDKGGYQIALIINNKNKLIGTLTDGDIRRALLKGISTKDSVEKMMNRNFSFIKDQDNPILAFEIMKRDVIRQIPVLDKKGRVLKLLVSKELSNNKFLSNPVVIMAGGRGKRLLPKTKNCPKPMLQINGKPMLEIVIEQCLNFGLNEFYISVNYLKEQIINYFGDGSSRGIKITYIEESQPLGTAGSLKLLPDKIKKPFLVLNGDVLTNANISHLLEFHNKNNSSATLCVQEQEMIFPYGVVEVNGMSLRNFNEKPTYKHLVNTGIYVLNPSILKLIKNIKFIDMPDLLELAKLKNMTVNVYPIHEYWLDIGLPESLKKASSEWSTIDK